MNSRTNQNGHLSEERPKWSHVGSVNCPVVGDATIHLIMSSNCRDSHLPAAQATPLHSLCPCLDISTLGTQADKPLHVHFKHHPKPKGNSLLSGPPLTLHAHHPNPSPLISRTVSRGPQKSRRDSPPECSLACIRSLRRALHTRIISSFRSPLSCSHRSSKRRVRQTGIGRPKGRGPFGLKEANAQKGYPPKPAPRRRDGQDGHGFMRRAVGSGFCGTGENRSWSNTKA